MEKNYYVNRCNTFEVAFNYINLHNKILCHYPLPFIDFLICYVIFSSCVEFKKFLILKFTFRNSFKKFSHLRLKTSINLIQAGKYSLPFYGYVIYFIA